MVKMKTTILILLISVILPSSHAVQEPRSSGKLDIERQRLLFHSDTDPAAEWDHFGSLSEADKHKYWSIDEDGYVNNNNVADKLLKLRELEVIVHVSVVLVGFNGDGRAQLKISSKELEAFLDSVRKSTPIHTCSRHNVEWAPDNTLPIHAKYLFSVQQAQRKLAHELHRQIREYIKTNDSLSIPVSLVDKIIQEDANTQPPTSYLLYILNLKAPMSGSHAKMYSYFDEDISTEQSTKCSLNSWAGVPEIDSGSEMNSRYAWVDLTAFPSQYGPKSGGRGLVTEYSVPRLANYRDSQNNGINKASLLPAMTAYIFKTCDYLFSPPVDHLPIPFTSSARRIHVEMVVVHDGTDEMDDPDWDSLVEIVDNLVIAGGQTLTFSKQRLSLHECSGCTRALASSMFGQVSPILRSGLSIDIRQYIDSATLRQSLHKILPILVRKSNDDSDGESDSDVVLVPVVVYSLKTDNMLLIDRLHQVVAFDDMVIAVQTRVGNMKVDYQCNGHSVSVSSVNINRPLLGSILQCVWGVAPTHLIWDQTHNSTSPNYLWSLSRTPFGAFGGASRPGISFSQHDSALRNIILSHMSSYVRELNVTLRHFVDNDNDNDVDYIDGSFFSSRERIEFNRRWLVLAFKLRSFSKDLTIHNYENALWWIKSMAIDVEVIHSLVHTAGDRVLSYLDCDGASSGSISDWSYLNMFTAFTFVFSVFILVLALRRGLRVIQIQKKRKKKD